MNRWPCRSRFSVQLVACCTPLLATVAQRPSAPDATPVTLSVNLPAYRLDVHRGAEERLRRSYPIAIGMRQYKTPTGEFQLSEIVWNPWWVPPSREWAAKDTVTPPGPTNPMGRVKLQFGSLLYAHATPFPGTIGRAASHGCLRLREADAIELAVSVQRWSGIPIDSATLDSLTVLHRSTRRVVLIAQVPVHVRYDVAEVRDSLLHVYPDVYRARVGGVTREAMRALASAGYDTTRVNRRLLGRVVARSTRRPSTVRLDSLIVAAATR